MANILGKNLDQMISKIGESFSKLMPDDPFPQAQLGGGDPFGGLALGAGGDPFGGAGFGGVGDPFGGFQQNMQDPFPQAQIGGRDPFGTFNLANNDPFGNFAMGNTNPFGQFAMPGDPWAGRIQTSPNAPDAATQAYNQGRAYGNTQSSSGSGKGATGIAGDEIWGRIDQYAGLIDGAAADAGIDGDIFRAIMYNESNGIPTASNSIGASGLLQLMPSVWQGQGDPFDPATNLRLGAKLMKDKVAGVKAAYAKNGITADERTYARDLALAWAGHFDYSTGRPNPTSTDVLFGQTADQLSNVFLSHYDALKAARTKQAPVASGPGLFGGGSYPITQEFGKTDFSGGEGASIYDFGSQFGLDGDEHSGLDIGTPDGTRFYSPVGGTVSIAGGSGYYKDETGRNPATSGEIRIVMDDGSELILGHNSQINVQVGQRINPGDLLGLTGTANGPHLHVEMRVRDSSTPSGWRIIDPRTRIKI